MEESGSQLRRDAHHGGWVLHAFQPEREQLLAIPRDAWMNHTPNALADPQGAGAHVLWSKTAALPDGREHTVRVIANRFALYRVEGNEDREGVGLYDLMRGVGAHEIIIESPQPEDTLISMSPYQYALAIQAMQERILDLRRDFRLRSFSVFREWLCGNTTPTHPHAQLIANATIPLGLKNELDAARGYFDYKDRCLFCDMIRQELKDKDRLVMATDDYVTFCPFASRYPFEVHLFPRRHACDFCQEPGDRLPALAAAIRDTALRLEESIPGWRVLMALHTAPVFGRHKVHPLTITHDFHWHIEFMPMPPGYIDWYSRTGTHVEYTAPENAAAYMRGLSVPSHWT